MDAHLDSLKEAKNIILQIVNKAPDINTQLDLDITYTIFNHPAHDFFLDIW